MKAKAQQIITIGQIIEALDTKPLADARTLLYQSKNAQIAISALVLKVVKREGLKLHLLINTEPSTRKMEAHAVFTDEQEMERVKDLKVKKGSCVEITGKFQTCGDSALNLTDCRVEVDKLAPKKGCRNPKKS